jgi:SagB-type dehydrogenase family enzyme
MAVKTLRFFLAASLFLFSAAHAQEVKTIKLPEPQKEIGKPVMQALNLCQSARSFSTDTLSAQEISNILWAAFGINRNESGKHTAPSAMNWQETDIYLVSANGAFRYDAKENSLLQITDEDVRALAGKQDYVKTAAINLIYVSDYSKIKNSSDEERLIYSGADIGFIAENAYLYCASQNLAVVVRAMIDREALSKKLSLKPDQKIILGQSIGYPKK